MKAEIPENDLNAQITNDSQSKLICKKCRQGIMLPAVEEGDPEYTDNFICSNCQYRDTIPTKDLLFSQLVTALTGIGICIYLLSGQLSKLFQGIQHDTLTQPTGRIALTILASIFMSGFIYLLFKAQEGFSHRKLYTKQKDD